MNPSEGSKALTLQDGAFDSNGYYSYIYIHRFVSNSDDRMWFIKYLLGLCLNIDMLPDPENLICLHIAV